MLSGAATANRLFTPPHGSPKDLMTASEIVQEGLPTQSLRTAAMVTLDVVQTWPRESIVRLLVKLQPVLGVSGSVPSPKGRPFRNSSF